MYYDFNWCFTLLNADECGLQKKFSMFWEMLLNNEEKSFFKTCILRPHTDFAIHLSSVFAYIEVLVLKLCD